MLCPLRPDPWPGLGGRQLRLPDGPALPVRGLRVAAPPRRGALPVAGPADLATDNPGRNEGGGSPPGRLRVRPVERPPRDPASARVSR